MATTQPVSYVKAHLAEVIESVRGSHDAVTITQNGSPSVVLVDYESYQRTRDALEMRSRFLIELKSVPKV